MFIPIKTLIREHAQKNPQLAATDALLHLKVCWKEIVLCAAPNQKKLDRALIPVKIERGTLVIAATSSAAIAAAQLVAEHILTQVQKKLPNKNITTVRFVVQAVPKTRQ